MEDIDDIFEFVEAPADRAGFIPPDPVDGVGLPKLVARRFKRACCIRCSGPITDTDRRWAVPRPLLTTMPT